MKKIIVLILEIISFDSAGNHVKAAESWGFEDHSEINNFFLIKNKGVARHSILLSKHF